MQQCLVSYRRLRRLPCMPDLLSESLIANQKSVAILEVQS